MIRTFRRFAVSDGWKPCGYGLDGSRYTNYPEQRLEPEIELADLRSAWGPLNLENYVHRLARPDLDVQMVLARRDTVVMPELSESLLRSLKNAGGRSHRRQNAGEFRCQG